MVENRDEQIDGQHSGYDDDIVVGRQVDGAYSPDSSDVDCCIAIDDASADEAEGEHWGYILPLAQLRIHDVMSSRIPADFQDGEPLDAGLMWKKFQREYVPAESFSGASSWRSASEGQVGVECAESPHDSALMRIKHQRYLRR